MAYMNQEKKAKINTALKAIMPKDWKWSLSVRHHSTIVLTIASAPIDLLAIVNAKCAENCKSIGMDFQPNTSAEISYCWKKMFTGELLDLFSKISAALNIDNFDNSDAMTDYFHVGHYVDLHIGRWNKPFTCTAQVDELAVAA